jgi:hypothetical protein
MTTHYLILTGAAPHDGLFWATSDLVAQDVEETKFVGARRRARRGGLPTSPQVSSSAQYPQFEIRFGDFRPLNLSSTTYLL